MSTRLVQLVRQTLVGTHASRLGGPQLVGIYGLPRGGTNFLAAQLHYHRQVFAVSEREMDWRQPLRKYWKKRSLFGVHGRQSKRPADVQRIVFNKVQRDQQLWGHDADLAGESKLIFYVRNPIRVHHSREAYRREHEPDRAVWADTDANFDTLVGEFADMLGVHQVLQSRYQCLVLAHEYLCCSLTEALSSVNRFLDIDDQPVGDARTYFQHCGKCGAPFEIDNQASPPRLVCTGCREALQGYGQFNPLRSIDRHDIETDAWKTWPQTDQRMVQIRRRLGDTLADYYWRGDYTQNLLQCQSKFVSSV